MWNTTSTPSSAALLVKPTLESACREREMLLQLREKRRGWSPFRTRALSRRSRVTYWARPECKARPRSPNCSAGSRTMLSPKSAMRTQYSLCRISISTKCRAAKPMPPVTTHHLSWAAMSNRKPTRFELQIHSNTHYSVGELLKQ